jgi:hypothetical protein
MPESFSVLIHELRGLCLDMQLLGGDADKFAPAARQAADSSADADVNDLLGGVTL